MQNPSTRFSQKSSSFALTMYNYNRPSLMQVAKGLMVDTQCPKFEGQLCFHTSQLSLFLKKIEQTGQHCQISLKKEKKKKQGTVILHKEQGNKATFNVLQTQVFKPPTTKEETYHLVKDTIRNPRNTVSSRTGAKTPVMPTKQAVLPNREETPLRKLII